MALAAFSGVAGGQQPGPAGYETPPRFRQYTPAPVLRWQPGDVSAARNPYRIRPASHDETGAAGSVRQAVQFAPNGAFADPFGDRVAQGQGAAAQPGAAAPPDATLPAPAAPGALQPSPALPIPADQGGPPMLDFDAAPRVPPSPSNRGFRPEGDQVAEPPCDRIYNDRNCCDEDQRCQNVRDFLRRMSITSISVDITPAFRPETGRFYSEGEPQTEDIQPQGVDDSRVGQLALAGPRTWRNQQGEIIAEGRWTDYRYGRLFISRGDGDVVQIPVHELSDDDLCFVNSWWNLPAECTLGGDPFYGRHFVQTTFAWKASALCHKPLYFEELQLERYGHTAGPIIQPVLSGAHFFGSIAFLPYKMGVNPPNECIYQLGLYRPGSCAPWLTEPFPISLRGALFQTGAVLGGVYLIP